MYPSYLSYLRVRGPLWRGRRCQKMVLPAAIRGKSQRWVALSCDAHSFPSGWGRIGQPCVRSSSESDLERTFFSCSPFCAGNWMQEGLCLGKYLSDKKIPWQLRRRFGMAVAGNTPTTSFLKRICKMQSAVCRLCRTAREARGESTQADGLADETLSRINSAGCEGMATTAPAAHHSIWRHLYDSMHAA